MTVAELIAILEDMPQNAIVCNFKPTNLNTWVTIRHHGTVDAIPVLGRLTEPEYRRPIKPEYRRPINAQDEPLAERTRIVVIG